MTAFRVRNLVLAAGIVCGGCTIGARVDEFGPATSPLGALAYVSAAGSPSSVEGELISVGDEGLIIRTTEGLTYVRFSQIEEARFDDAPGVKGWSRAGNQTQHSRLAQFSRYPLGLQAAHLERLLAAMGQAELIEIEP